MCSWSNRRFAIAPILIDALIVLAATLPLGCGAAAADPAPPVAKSLPAPTHVNTVRTVGRPTAMNATIARLKPLHTRLGKPKPGEWLDQHQETGQSFQQYLRARPVTPTGKRTVIYVQPLGTFTPKQREIVELSAEYLGLYFSRRVKILEDLPPSTVPDSARRVHPEWGVPQVLTTYVLNQVLKRRLPDDAAAYIAFTSSDLWPGAGWNFVYGQASLRDRVGVWSIQRNGDPAAGDDQFRLCLRRTLKTATHETGHMFSIKHCIAYHCNMCGSNHRQESDRQPLYLCPECHAKIGWATNADITGRMAALAEFCRRHELEKEHEYYRKAIERLGGKK